MTTLINITTVHVRRVFKSIHSYGHQINRENLANSASTIICFSVVGSFRVCNLAQLHFVFPLLYTHHTCTYTLIHTHRGTVVCSQVPELCSGCPNATTRDGIICRAAAACHGGDSDRDGIPDSCDNCPYNFNPDQNSTFCMVVDGACPGDVALDIVWSRTSVGLVDIKRCPSPLIGKSLSVATQLV